MSTIHLVRHGQASAGTDHYDRLSARGRQQAELLGHFWHTGGFTAAAVFHGTLERQRDTATITCAQARLELPMQILPALDEYDHLQVDKLFADGRRSDAESSMTLEAYAAIMRRWRDAPDHTLDGLERFDDFTGRGWEALAAAQALAGAESPLVLFTSGGVIATVLARALNLDFDRTMEALWWLRNGSVTTLHYRDGHARLIDFNTIGHLQTTADPSLITLI